MWFSLISLPSLVTFSLILEAILAKPFVHLVYSQNDTCLDFKAVPACFGPARPFTGLTGYLVEAVPTNACHPIEAPPDSNGTELGFIVLIRRYDCLFGIKVLHAQQAGYQGAIIHNVYSDLLVSMAIEVQEIRDQISIPSLFIGGSAAMFLRKQIHAEKFTKVTTVVPPGYYNPCGTKVEVSLWDPSRYYVQFWPGYCTQQMIIMFLQEFGFVILLSLGLSILTFIGWVKWRQRNCGIRVKTFQSGDRYESCVICMAEYEAGDQLKILPCGHAYHNTCINTWLLVQPRTGKSCPICKQKINVAN
ncbi:E3 ubiquitin-protein ligase ZNRF4-like [Sceloporus undulatus]|uniref:E3 ubiquitin-protein ligase ZNRF4-like n=1 Tax=Sceloporus undulatus TaxID=8520 RepID=UPI001C4DB4EF|nr:E3 ubiquitin-protein ligase ZNRF4-like [Sceloporus undulatus]